MTDPVNQPQDDNGSHVAPDAIVTSDYASRRPSKMTTVLYASISLNVVLIVALCVALLRHPGSDRGAANALLASNSVTELGSVEDAPDDTGTVDTDSANAITPATVESDSIPESLPQDDGSPTDDVAYPSDAAVDQPASTMANSDSFFATPSSTATPGADDTESASSTASPDSQNTSDAKADKPETLPSNPFSRIAMEFPLPEIPNVSTGISESATAGAIAANDVTELQVLVNDSLADLAGQYRFHVEDADQGDRDQRRWNVLVKPAQQGLGRDVQLGHFVVDDLGQFRFLWEMSEPFQKAGQLTNCLLTLRLGSYEHSMQLRAVEHTARQPTLLTGSASYFPVELANLPTTQSVGVRVVVHPRGRIGYASNGTRTPPSPAVLRPRSPVLGQLAASVGNPILGELMTVGQQSDYSIDPDGKVKMFVKLEEAERGLQLGVVSQIERMVNGRSRFVNKSCEELKTDITKLSKTIGEAITEYGNSGKAILGLQLQRQPKIVRLQELRRQAAANPRSAPALNKEMNILSSQIGEIDLYLGKHSKIVESRLRSIPKSYEVLGSMLSSLKAATRVHNRGEFEYHLVAVADQTEIELLKADGKPNVERIEVQMPDLGVAGSWVRLQPSRLYEVAGDALRGSVVISNPMNPKSPRINGTWRRNGDTFIISTPGGDESYQLHEDIVMRSGSATLFRFPK